MVVGRDKDHTTFPNRSPSPFLSAGKTRQYNLVTPGLSSSARDGLQQKSCYSQSPK